MVDIEDTLGNPAFWLLGGGGAIAVIAGFIMSKNMGMASMPLWQVAAMIVVCFGAGAVFANQD